MKVCHLTSVHPRYDTRIFIKMCCSLQEYGFDTNLIVADGLGDEVIKGVKILDVGSFGGNRLLRMFISTYRVYRKARSLKADIFHFHDPELMFIGIILKLSGSKVIFDVHEDLPCQVLRKQWVPKLLRFPLSFFVKVAEYITAKTVSSVVTVTPKIADRFYFTKTVEVRNYVSLNEFSIKDLEINNKYRITYIGGITKDRGILSMVSAFSNLDYTFTLGGKFQETGLYDKAKSLPGWQHVEYLGWQSREQVTSILEETLIGLVVLQPTGDYEDAFPVKLFEYMAAGAAVIASDFPLWREIVDSSKCGICVDPTDSNAISQAIDMLMNNKELIYEMGQNGQKAVQNKYNWQGESDKLIELYRQLLS